CPSMPPKETPSGIFLKNGHFRWPISSPVVIRATIWICFANQSAVLSWETGPRNSNTSNRMSCCIWPKTKQQKGSWKDYRIMAIGPIIDNYQYSITKGKVCIQEVDSEIGK